ncbi:hypothetical protein EIN_015020 [Entamoeba invadens IP1]|uniref:hypothetical protein n=1 Tax=Entamoeba invadens IP1 TaxID=370355 RepID=UPI0002C3DC5E|nr:hypothetical protein EIN_015020 [Entamoeba invadens IP1]ELP90373.1 hypothetical protein EIN_015020 [Entamoeba invadens IP1]|eukprot:XP_004257144.1 hypothetical protein EIN_015020 [Entamoeba invadens IP1]
MSLKKRLAHNKLKLFLGVSRALSTQKSIKQKSTQKTATEFVYTTNIIVNGIKEDIIVAGSKVDLPPPSEFYPTNGYVKSDYNIFVVLVDSTSNELDTDYLSQHIYYIIPALEETDDYYFGEFEFFHYLVQNLVALVYYNTDKRNTHNNPKIEEMFHGRCLHFVIGDIDKESISRIIQKTITAKRSGFAGRYFERKPVILL